MGLEVERWLDRRALRWVGIDECFGVVPLPFDRSEGGWRGLETAEAMGSFSGGEVAFPVVWTSR
jgi:hypothetical protein